MAESSVAIFSSGHVVVWRKLVAAEILFCKVQCDSAQAAAVQAENLMWPKWVLAPGGQHSEWAANLST